MRHSTTIRRAGAILRVFSLERPRLGVTQLAAATGLHKSTAHRLAATLQVEGFLRRDPGTAQYELGGLIHRLGQLCIEANPMLAHGRPVLDELRESVGHTVSLAVLDRGEALFIVVVEGTRPIRATIAEEGHRLPVSVSAAGKVLLADRPLDEVRAIIRERGLPRLTAKSVTSASAFVSELRRVRREGVGFSREEFAMGVLTIAVPVRRGGMTVAAISLVCPTSLVTVKTLPGLIQPLQEAAEGLTARLERMTPGDGDGAPSNGHHLDSLNGRERRGAHR
jgi:DNA-binding IclR family transcriptional regulator